LNKYVDWKWRNGKTGDIASDSMLKRLTDTRTLLGLLLLYGLVLTVWNLGNMAVFVDEAYHINMGHQLLRGDPCPGCPFSSGWVFIHPVAVAVADAVGGLYGARAMSIILGLLLVYFIFITGRTLFNEKTGLIAAAIFLFSGQAPYLMRLSTYDMTAAFLLGCSFMIIVISTGDLPDRRRAFTLVAGMLILFLAAVSKYLLPAFVPAMVLYALYMHRFSKAMVFSMVMLFVLAALFWFFAPYSPKYAVLGQISDFKADTHVPFSILAERTLRWVGLAYILSVFGMFHKEHGRTAVILFLLSLPIILVHWITEAEQSLNKNVIFSFIFLAPASALGVDRIGSLFAMKSPGRALQRFFSIATIVIFWVYGFQHFRWLEKQYPNVRPMIEFFDEKGFDGMTVILNGWDSDIYSYSLNAKYPHARYLHITEAVEKDENGDWTGIAADFLICEDNYYGRFYPCTDYGEYIDENYEMLEHFMFELSWGITDSKIYGRR
jgi:4-amino-4-deoxy-L-arabinose transferase-like glycosyltransferase